MKQFIFNTGNETKYLNAKAVCDNYEIRVIQNSHEVEEIQGEDPKKVAIDKAKKAFEALKKPVVITDDSWAFMGLNGFPGVYMHSMNDWLTPEDFLRLSLPLTDRRVILTQFLIFKNEAVTKIFKAQTEGELLDEIRGTSPHPSHTIVTMPGDDGLSIAEVYNKGLDRSKRNSAQIWHEFAKWYAG